MKKERVIIILLFALSIILSGIVAAQGFSYGYGFFGSLQNSLSPFLAALFGSTQYMMEKFLFLIILLVVVYSVAIRIPVFQDKYAVSWIVSISISLITVRFLSETAWVKAALLPYHAMGVSLLCFIPFLIFFYLIEKGIEEGMVRKVAWILYSVIYFGLWYARYDELQGTSYIFLLTSVLSLLTMGFDSTIQGMFVRSAIKQGLNIDRTKVLVGLHKQIDDDMKLLQSARGDERRNILKDIAEKEKTYKKLSKRHY